MNFPHFLISLLCVQNDLEFSLPNKQNTTLDLKHLLGWSKTILQYISKVYEKVAWQWDNLTFSDWAIFWPTLNPTVPFFQKMSIYDSALKANANLESSALKLTLKYFSIYLLLSIKW